MGWQSLAVLVEEEYLASQESRWTRIEELMAPYAVGLEVEPWEDDCFCAGRSHPDCSYCDGKGTYVTTSNPQERWQVRECDDAPDMFFTIPRKFRKDLKVPFPIHFGKPISFERLVPDGVCDSFLSERTGWVDAWNRGSTNDYEGDWDRVFQRESAISRGENGAKPILVMYND